MILNFLKYVFVNRINLFTLFLSRFGASLESSLIFAKKYVHFSKQFVRTVRIRTNSTIRTNISVLIHPVFIHPGIYTFGQS